MISLCRIDLTWFSRPLARHVPRRGLVDHKWTVTQSSGRENQAFGGPNQPTGCVAAFARCTTSRCTPRLTGGLIWHHQMTRHKEIML